MKTFVRFLSFLSGWLPVASMGAPAAAVTRVNPAINSALTAKIERVAPDRAKLFLTPKFEAGVKIKLLDNDGKEVAAAVAADGTLQAEVDPRRAYIVTQPTRPRRALPPEGLTFPARYVTFAANGAANLGGLFLRPTRMPLTWDDTTKTYATELLVGYEFQDGAERVLGAPKTVRLFAEGPSARIVADSVVIAQSGSPGYQRVTLTTGDFSGETQFTARASPTDEITSSVTVHREPGGLKLTLPSTEIPAFGVGSGTLTVSLVARDGSPLAAEQPLEVQLTSRRLRVPPSVTLGAGKSSAEVDFRSSGIGSDQVRAETGVLMSMQAVRLIFPVAATVAAVAGGLAGGAARYLRNRRKRGGLLMRRLVEGLLVGVIFVGAAWAGLVTVDLGAGVLGTPFGAFVLAALSGYVGCVILDRVADRTFKGLKAEA